MSEKNLREAFESMGPDEAAKKRMLQNILSAHADADATLGSAISATSGSEAPPAQAGHQHTPEALEAQPATKRQHRRRAREFSLMRYALPLAACLLIAFASPALLPQVAEIVEESAATVASDSEESSGSSGSSYQPDSANEPEETEESAGSAENSSSSSGTDIATTPLDPSQDTNDQEEAQNQGGEAQSEAPGVVAEEGVPALTEEVPIATGGAPLMALPEPEPFWVTPAGFATIALSVCAGLAALVIAIRGILAWRRSKKQK